MICKSNLKWCFSKKVQFQLFKSDPTKIAFGEIKKVASNATCFCSAISCPLLTQVHTHTNSNVQNNSQVNSNKPDGFEIIYIYIFHIHREPFW